MIWGCFNGVDGIHCFSNASQMVTKSADVAFFAAFTRQTLVWNRDTLQPFFLFITRGIVGRHNVRHVDLLTFAVASL